MVRTIHCDQCDHLFEYDDSNPFICRCPSCHKTTKYSEISHVVIDGSAQSSKHYQHGRLQPIEIIQDTLSSEQFIGFLWGNVIKYSLRRGRKDDTKKEDAKVEQYSKWLQEAERGMLIDPMKETREKGTWGDV